MIPLSDEAYARFFNRHQAQVYADHHWHLQQEIKASKRTPAWCARVRSELAAIREEFKPVRIR